MEHVLMSVLYVSKTVSTFFVVCLHSKICELLLYTHQTCNVSQQRIDSLHKVQCARYMYGVYLVTSGYPMWWRSMVVTIVVMYTYNVHQAQQRFEVLKIVKKIVLTHTTRIPALPLHYLFSVVQ